jgi:hypothetical protein
VQAPIELNRGVLVAEMEGRRPDHGADAGSLAEFASVIASLAAECPIPAKRIEVWRYGEQAPPTPDRVQEYLVLQSFARDINLARFAERASTQDSPALRKARRRRNVAASSRG